MLTNKLEESNRKQLEMKNELSTVQVAFETFKASANAELSTTLMQADKTISDLSKKLSERKKLLRKFNSEIKRLQKEIGNYKVLVDKYKSNKEGDEVRNDSQDVVITLKKKCAQYEASIDELKNRNKKLQVKLTSRRLK